MGFIGVWVLSVIGAPKKSIFIIFKLWDYFLTWMPTYMCTSLGGFTTALINVFKCAMCKIVHLLPSSMHDGVVTRQSAHKCFYHWISPIWQMSASCPPFLGIRELWLVFLGIGGTPGQMTCPWWIPLPGPSVSLFIADNFLLEYIHGGPSSEQQYFLTSNMTS